YRLSAPRGQRVVRSSVTIEGRAIDPAARYRVVMPDFLWNGGDRFAAPLEGTDSTSAVVDLDAVIAYLGRHQPAAAPGDPRITLLP
ncbi:MAG: 5'-nucleotidase C-terminal domain-containing protein, partial [Vicinamibacterales bacterium]